jgi:hypothetical protein
MVDADLGTPSPPTRIRKRVSGPEAGASSKRLRSNTPTPEPWKMADSDMGTVPESPWYPKPEDGLAAQEMANPSPEGVPLTSPIEDPLKALEAERSAYAELLREHNEFKVRAMADLDTVRRVSRVAATRYEETVSALEAMTRRADEATAEVQTLREHIMQEAAKGKSGAFRAEEAWAALRLLVEEIARSRANLNAAATDASRASADLAETETRVLDLAARFGLPNPIRRSGVEENVAGSSRL